MVNDLENNIIAGLLLVIAVLYFFMGGRNGLLVGIAIPISMLLSFVVISMLGYTLNMIVLFSLILALGMLVDNAIVMSESIMLQVERGKPVKLNDYTSRQLLLYFFPKAYIQYDLLNFRYLHNIFV
mgnify:CR=1 FL=1